eukprot:jgi/Phyca11/114337/e_gw1.26.138.1
METAIIAGTGRANEEKQDTPIEENHLQYDDEEAEALTFVEMYSFLVDQIKDQTMEQALEAEKETAFMQELFEMIFEQHPDDFLPPGRRRYPQLEDEELELLYKLFILDLKEGHMDSRKWKGRLQTVTRAIYKSRSSLSETLEVLVKSVQAKPAPATNPWSKRLFTEQPNEEKEDFSLLSFRNRKFPLRNVHDDEQTTPVENDQRSKIVWSRQVGADGIKNELARDRYHVRLLNLSRFLDESAIDAYIQQNFEGIYHTWQEPTTAGQIPQTDTWDIFFRSGYCPTFLNGIRFINWDGTKILVHHVS